MIKVVKRGLWGLIFLIEFGSSLFSWYPVLDFHSDRILFRATKKLSPPKEGSARTLLLTGYYFGRSHILIDTLLYLALSRAGHRVIPVVTGDFFTRECLYFGGNYKDWRTLRIRTVAAIELKVWRRIMRVDPIEISEYFSESDVMEFNRLGLQDLRFDKLKTFRLFGFDIFGAATRVHANMTDSPVADNTLYSQQAIRAHCANIARYLIAFRNLFEAVQPQTLVCNSAFYYKWSVPAHLAKKKNIAVYTYMLSDKPNSFFFSQNMGHLLQIEDIPGSIENFIDTHNLRGVKRLDSIRSDWLSFYASSLRTDYAETLGLLPPGLDKTDLFETPPAPNLKRVLVALNHPSDAAVLQGSPIFSDYKAFLSGMTKLASRFPSVHFVFKIHPAEKLHDKQPTFRSSLNFLQDAGLDELPNCQVIPARSKVSVDKLILESGLVVCYTSSVGITASIRGIATVQCSFSANRSPELVLCPNTFEELEEAVRSSLFGSASNKKALEQRADSALLYSMVHHIHSEIDTGLFVINELTRKGVIRRHLDENDIMNNPFLGFIAETIDQQKPFSCRDRIPPASGSANLVNGRLLVE